MIDAGGQHLAQQVLHGREVGQAGEPSGVPLLDVPPRVAEEVVDVEDRDPVQGSGVGGEYVHGLLEDLRRVEPVLAEKRGDLGVHDVPVPVLGGLVAVVGDEVAVADFKAAAEFAVVADDLVERGQPVADEVGQGGVGAV